MGWSHLGDTEGLFDRGMDSLQALPLFRALRRSFHRPDVALSTVYQNPTVSQLAAIILGQTHQKRDREFMKNLLATYKERIQWIPVSKNTGALTKNARERTNVLVTGTTGIVGTHLLGELLDNNSVGHIFCLNRREDGWRSSQFENFTTVGFDVTQLGDNNHVTFLRPICKSRPLALKVPDSLGPYFDNIDFLPVDPLGNILTEIATTTQAKEVGKGGSGAVVYNLRNPRPAPWRELLTAVTYKPGRRLEVVPPAAWLGTLRASTQGLEKNDDLIAKNPEVKLVDFFEKLWVAHSETDSGSPQHPMRI